MKLFAKSKSQNVGCSMQSAKIFNNMEDGTVVYYYYFSGSKLFIDNVFLNGIWLTNARFIPKINQIGETIKTFHTFFIFC